MNSATKEITLQKNYDALDLPMPLYPAFAPLPIPFANHLVLQEYKKKYRRVVPSKRPAPQEIWQRVLTRVKRARSIVFEVMDPFVQVDALKPRRGRGMSFPSGEWILDTLANHTPAEIEPKDLTIENLNHWVQRGLLVREWERGPFDRTRVAAFLIARIAEEVHENNWLPSAVDSSEPHWWCYGKPDSHSSQISVPVPLSKLPASTLLWTPWTGASWDNDWHIDENAPTIACRWSPTPPTKDDFTAYGISL